MLSCRELIDFIAAYLDDDLETEERNAFEAHLRLCPHCVAYLASYSETLRLERRACEPDAELPADVPAELVDAILAARRS